MKKLIFFNLITLDGYFEGLNREIDWHNVDEEFNQLAIEQLETVGTLLFGRVTYELMASYWPSSAALEDDPIIAKWMNELPKVVFSRTLDTANWHNTRLVKDNAPAEILRLKHQPGKDMIIFGSSDLAVSLLPSRVIDEFRLMVNPIFLGQGKTMFKGLSDRIHLKLIDHRASRSGNVLLTYQAA